MPMAARVSNNNTAIVVLRISFAQVDVLTDGDEAQRNEEQNQSDYQHDAHDVIICLVDTCPLGGTPCERRRSDEAVFDGRDVSVGGDREMLFQLSWEKVYMGLGTLL